MGGNDMVRKVAILLAILALGATGALAQSVEVTPSIGYRFGGNFDDVGNANARGDASLDDSETYGISFDFITRDGWGIEVNWSTQSPTLDTSDSIIPDGRFGARMTTFQVGYIHQFRRDTSTQPFFLATVGGAQLKVQGETNNGFSYAAAGGAKFYFGDHFGLRLQGTLMHTRFSSADTFVCSDTTCYGLTEPNMPLQFEASAGLIFRF
jgi:hypothetical protein